MDSAERRKKATSEAQERVLTSCARRCPFCYGLNGDLDRKQGQLAHIHRDRSNSAEGNLAFLCLDHHAEYDATTSQAKGTTPRELSRYKTELERAIANKEHRGATAQLDGQGGRGGGGNAAGRNSLVVGGRGGKAGGPGGARGGDGGGGDASGEGSIVIGGDGGDAGRADGRGGAGGASPLKKLSAEVLASFGLTGSEGYGQGGRGASSAEYDRSLRLLCRLSGEYASAHPSSPMTPMLGVLMPPVEWVNDRLSDLRESFRVELVDNETDFFLRPVVQMQRPSAMHSRSPRMLATAIRSPRRVARHWCR